MVQRPSTEGRKKNLTPLYIYTNVHTYLNLCIFLKKSSHFVSYVDFFFYLCIANARRMGLGQPLSTQTEEQKENCGRALHNGKASHDVLSIGYLKLPQKMCTKDNAELMPRVC